MWWKSSHAELHGTATPAGFILAERDIKKDLFSKADFFFLMFRLSMNEENQIRNTILKNYSKKGNIKNVAFIGIHFLIAIKDFVVKACFLDISYSSFELPIKGHCHRLLVQLSSLAPALTCAVILRKPGLCSFPTTVPSPVTHGCHRPVPAWIPAEPQGHPAAVEQQDRRELQTFCRASPCLLPRHYTRQGLSAAPKTAGCGTE